jgi:hypothetical protein
MGVGGKNDAPDFLPSRKTQYPLYGRLGGPQGWSGQLQKISPPTRIQTLDLQPIAICYTDSATRDSTKVINIIIKVYTGLQTTTLARHIFAIQKEDAKPCMQNTLHIRSNDDTHLTHTNK